ncbi:hypothetical protein NBRC116602_21890 [Hyphomicrobiales bacterium 4NK60-0047b]
MLSKRGSVNAKANLCFIAISYKFDLVDDQIIGMTNIIEIDSIDFNDQ